MKIAMLCAATVLIGCGSATESGAGQGVGGMPSSSTIAGVVAASSIAAAASSTSASGGDAGSGDAGMCSTCKKCIVGTEQTAAAANLCAGSEAETFYFQFVNCGCAVGGACTTDCGKTSWCVGLSSTPMIWVDPAGTCKTCLDAFDTGCGAAELGCWKH